MSHNSSFPENLSVGRRVVDFSFNQCVIIYKLCVDYISYAGVGELFFMTYEVVLKNTFEQLLCVRC